MKAQTKVVDEDGVRLIWLSRDCRKEIKRKTMLRDGYSVRMKKSFNRMYEDAVIFSAYHDLKYYLDIVDKELKLK